MNEIHKETLRRIGSTAKDVGITIGVVALIWLVLYLIVELIGWWLILLMVIAWIAVCVYDSVYTGVKKDFEYARMKAEHEKFTARWFDLVEKGAPYTEEFRSQRRHYECTKERGSS